MWGFGVRFDPCWRASALAVKQMLASLTKAEVTAAVFDLLQPMLGLVVASTVGLGQTRRITKQSQHSPAEASQLPKGAHQACVGR